QLTLRRGEDCKLLTTALLADYVGFKDGNGAEQAEARISRSLKGDSIPLRRNLHRSSTNTLDLFPLGYNSPTTSYDSNNSGLVEVFKASSKEYLPSI
ncbi:hypothetical protein HAX54_000207, partial [Datura stramonium]|nr:hypothetical protein [Datura stramonium]